MDDHRFSCNPLMWCLSANSAGTYPSALMYDTHAELPYRSYKNGEMKHKKVNQTPLHSTLPARRLLLFHIHIISCRRGCAVEGAAERS